MLKLKVAVVAFVFLWSASGARTDEQVNKLSEEQRRWLEEEVVYIITDREKDIFLILESQEERNGFIEAFWRKH